MAVGAWEGAAEDSAAASLAAARVILEDMRMFLCMKLQATSSHRRYGAAVQRLQKLSRVREGQCPSSTNSGKASKTDGRMDGGRKG